jgi:hypothetical protein
LSIDPLALFCIGLTPQAPRRPGRTSSVVTPSLLRIAPDPLSPTFVTNSYPFVG